jgi:hypothetical protein
MVSVFDTRPCSLGEGPLWHPLRGELFWFDINAHQLLSKTALWQFDEYVSAAGWISQDELLIASESQLLRFHLRDHRQTKICDLEADNPITRSNDGRCDPQGGFWIGTMGKKAEAKPERFTDIIAVIWCNCFLRSPFPMPYVSHQMGIPPILPTPRSGKFWQLIWMQRAGHAARRAWQWI